MSPLILITGSRAQGRANTAGAGAGAGVGAGAGAGAGDYKKIRTTGLEN